MNKIRVCGIDPGLDGAFVLLYDDGQYLEYWDMPVKQAPTKAHPNKRDYDLIQLVRISKEISKACEDNLLCWVLEDVHSMPSQGVVSVGSFMRGKGLLEMLCFVPSHKVGSSLLYVTPQRWKKHFNLLRTEKKDAIALAEKYNLPCKNKSGRADAFLIARYYYDTKVKSKDEESR